jgi:oligopeptide transport system permease protein
MSIAELTPVAARPRPRARWSIGGEEAERLLAQAAEARGESLWSDAARRLRRNRAAWYCLLFLAAFALVSIAAPLWPLPSPVALSLQSEPQAPVAPWVELGRHGFAPEYWHLNAIDAAAVDLRQRIFGDWQTGPWLGTDSKGRDLLARIVWGSRTSLLVALMATLCSLAIGVTYGAFAGLAGGRVDNLMMRFVDVLYSIPFIFLVIFLVTIVNAYRAELEQRFGIDREIVFYLVIGAVYWLTMARVVRGQVLALRQREFVEAARVLGASTPRVLFVHIVPNVLSIVIVYLTLTIPAVMLFEAFLSFLGLGIEPPKVSWGLLAVDGTDAINPLRLYWWLAVWPAAAMGSVLLALNILGDGLRDALDPKLRGND